MCAVNSPPGSAGRSSTRYSDHAVSGATLLRAGFQALMRDALNKRFDVVLAESLDRFSRDQEDTAGLFKRLTFAGVNIVTLAEGDITFLHIGFKGTNPTCLADRSAAVDAILLSALTIRAFHRQRQGIEPGGVLSRPGSSAYKGVSDPPAAEASPPRRRPRGSLTPRLPCR